MKKSFLIILLLNFIFMTAQTQDPWTEYISPGSNQEFLAKYAGDFEMEIKMFPDPGKTPSLIQSKNSMILGDRFLEMKQSGKMMGMDYEANLTIGFNNTDKNFTVINMTNFGTGILSLSGKWEIEHKKAIVYGKLTNPVTKNSINVKQIISFTDENSILIESFDTEGGQPETKTTEYKFIRKNKN